MGIVGFCHVVPAQDSSAMYSHTVNRRIFSSAMTNADVGLFFLD